MKKNKVYVVWKGINPGIYDRWEDCKEQVEGYEGARYKSFETKEAAINAFDIGYSAYKKANPSTFTPKGTTYFPTEKKVIEESICVDAACSGNPGDMEYRGVYTKTGQEIFHVGPYPKGTNNIGEFLALVHGLALLKQKDSNIPIYTDSRNAMVWVKNKKCKTLLERLPENEVIFDLIERAEKWLKENSYNTNILKWPTDQWGEIPADFGRK